MSAESQSAHSAEEVGAATAGQAVFRHRAMVTGFVAGSGLLGLLVALAWSEPTAGNIAGSAVLAAGLWFGWAAGWWTKVVVSGDGVRIDNVFFEHVIPWRVFVDFFLDGGLVARLSDGTRLPVVSFGGSLAGAITQYRGMSRKRDAMMASCWAHRAAGQSAAGQYQRLIKPHWVALLAYELPVAAIAVGIDAARHLL